MTKTDEEVKGLDLNTDHVCNFIVSSGEFIVQLTGLTLFYLSH